MRVSLKKSDTFIPDWNGNLDMPEEEQVKFHYSFLGSGERAKYVYRKPVTYTFDGKGEGQFGNVEMIQDGKGITLRMVKRIENLEAEQEDGRVIPIENIVDFYKYDFADLKDVVEAHMLAATAVVDSKNSA